MTCKSQIVEILAAVKDTRKENLKISTISVYVSYLPLKCGDSERRST
nr:MAG TPA: hypothetical protein [Caudoviricetes sp.]